MYAGNSTNPDAFNTRRGKSHSSPRKLMMLFLIDIFSSTAVLKLKELKIMKC